MKDLTPEDQQKKRSEQAKPVLTAILAWSKTRTAAPKSKLGIALNYLKNQWPTLTTYLQDGRIELSNNRAERSIKPFVSKRKITCTYQRAARYEIMEWEVAERFGKWRNVPEYSETALEG